MLSGRKGQSQFLPHPSEKLGELGRSHTGPFRLRRKALRPADQHQREERRRRRLQGIPRLLPPPRQGRPARRPLVPVHTLVRGRGSIAVLPTRGGRQMAVDRGSTGFLHNSWLAPAPVSVPLDILLDLGLGYVVVDASQVPAGPFLSCPRSHVLPSPMPDSVDGSPGRGTRRW